MKKLLDYSHKNKIDLHIHSNVSDGVLSPSEILNEALALGLKAISITDHDTMEGSKKILENSIPNAIKFLSGVEVSASPPPGFGIPGSIHILGYGVNPFDINLSECLKSLKDFRIYRARKIIDRLNAMGIIIDEGELFSEAGASVIGRPHFANLMVKKGLVTSFKDAFDKFLSQGKAAYVGKKKVKVEKIIALIQDAGGVAILAHPYLIGIKKVDVFEKFVKILKSMGLAGLEIIYPEHPTYISNLYLKLAHLNGLIVTGGTDFHGYSTKSNFKIGVGRGDFCVPFSIYQNLIRSIGESL